MRKNLAIAIALAGIAAAPAAFAQDEEKSDITITGSVAVTSEYRLRGISQTDSDPAIQGGITVSHAPTGVYLGTWASNLAGNGSWGGSNMELDLIFGKTTSVGPVTLDGGIVYYVYPGTKGHDYIEIYGSVSGTVGPVVAKGGLFWAPSQKNLAPGTGLGANNIWLYTDLALPIEGTPLTLKGHAGVSKGNSIYTQGGAARLVGKSTAVFDYGIGADFTYKNLTLNVSYLGTDMNRNFANTFFGAGTHSGREITKGAVVATLTAAF